MTTTSTIEVGFNAGRVCEAIARIGYEAHTAIMDLVDNSVTAGATWVKVSLYLAPGKNLKSRNSVRSYQIVDNGSGMDEEGIKKAFALGSDVTYPKNSLSKYGMGLKSAGLSLGSRINIITKKEGTFSDRYTFDKDVIAHEGKFVITKFTLSTEHKKHYQLLCPDQSGTIVEIEGCESVNHPSPKATIEKLKDRLGVVYFSFLHREKDPLSLFTRVCPAEKDEPFDAINAKDMLFMSSSEFKQHYNPETYDYSSPYLALDEQWKIQAVAGTDLPPIKVQAVVFPQAAMALQQSPLSPEKKKMVASYAILRENKGFYIYRNGRLIRWGDDLEGLISKDEINIRIRVDLHTEHDDVLHVDVTKQRLEIDDEILHKLEGIISHAKKTAESIRADCQKKLNEGSDQEGAAFTSTVKNVSEDDPDELTTGDLSPETQQRRKKRAEEGAKVIGALKEETVAGEPGQHGAQPSSATATDEFHKIVYSEKVPYGHVWEPHYDAKEGIFVCISKHHPFYQEFLSRMPENSPERICAEALIFAAAVGESNVKDKYEVVSPDQLDKIFDKYHKNIGVWLSNWTSENTSIFTK
jgi:hypothetical protein